MRHHCIVYFIEVNVNSYQRCGVPFTKIRLLIEQSAALIVNGVLERTLRPLEHSTVFDILSATSISYFMHLIYA